MKKQNNNINKGLEFSGDPKHAEILDSDAGGAMGKTLGPLMWCIAGGNTEVVMTEYGFLASLRWQMSGTRDIVIADTDMMSNWASLQKQEKAKGCSSGSSNRASLSEIQGKFMSMSDKNAVSFLSDTDHWLEHGTICAGEVLFLPVGSMMASRTHADLNIGLKVGAVAPMDRRAVQALASLLDWSEAWYKGSMTDHLEKTLAAAKILHDSEVACRKAQL